MLLAAFIDILQLKYIYLRGFNDTFSTLYTSCDCMWSVVRIIEINCYKHSDSSKSSDVMTRRGN